MRGAVLLAKLGAGLPVDRKGAGAVVEVYPAASLLSWGPRHLGHKQRRMAEALAARGE